MRVTLLPDLRSSAVLLACAGLLVAASGCRDAVDDNVATVARHVRANDYAALSALLDSSDEDLRCRAAKALVWARSKAAVEQHVALLKYDRCGWEVRAEAAWRLLEEEAFDQWPALAAQLADPDPAIRWNMAKVLGKMGEPAAIELLTQCVGDSDAFVAAWCKWAVCKLDGGADCSEPNMDLTEGKPGP